MPNPIVSTHTEPIAYLGGFAVGFGILVGMTPWIFSTRTSFLTWRWDILFGGALFLGIGAIDDARPMPPSRKLAIQATAALSIAALHVGLVSVWMTIVFAGCVIVLVNALNVTDVSDGLVAGLTIIGSLALAALGGLPNLGFSVAGACLGFLLLNAPPATIFLGDSGTHLAGFLLATMTFDVWAMDPTPRTIAMLMLVNGVALFEVVFLVVIRLRDGKPWWLGSPDHVALRLQARGLSRWATNALIWCYALSLVGLALLTREDHPGPAIATLIALGTAAIGGKWLSNRRVG